MRNPFRRRQKRESVTSQLLRAWTLAIADGGVNDPRTTSVGEAIAREYEAALAEVQSNHPALDPEIMGCIGRQLAVRGEWVGEINVVGGSIRLQEAADWDVTGDTGDPNSWMYQLTLPRPSGDRTEVVLGSGVVHLKYSTDPRSPWRGISPFDRMSASSRAVGGSEARFAEELASAVGFVVPVPATPQPEDDDDESGVDPLQELASDLRSLEGRTSLVETTSGGWGDGMANRPMEEWRPRRMGADPPTALAEIRRDNARAMLAACGLPGDMIGFGMTAISMPSHLRQAWLDFVIEPLLRRMEVELTRKLDTAISFTLPEVRDLELMRARADAARDA